jgi:hypothetical protein
MGIAAQYQADPAIANCLGKVRVVRKQDDGGALGSITKRPTKILAVCPEVANPVDLQLSAVVLKPYADNIQVRKSCVG